MANALQDSAREAFATGLIDWVGDDIRVLLVDSSYAYSADHATVDEVDNGARIDISDPLTGKTAAGGVLDADDITLESVEAGSEITGLWVVQDTGVESTSHLIAWYDTASSGMPISVTTNGGDIDVRWADTPNRIARI